MSKNVLFSWHLTLNWMKLFWLNRRRKKGITHLNPIRVDLSKQSSKLQHNRTIWFEELWEPACVVCCTYVTFKSTTRENEDTKNLTWQTMALKHQGKSQRMTQKMSWLASLTAQGCLIYTGHWCCYCLCRSCVILDSFVLSSYCYGSSQSA